RSVRPGSAGRGPGTPGAPLRGRELLCERQADRRRGRPAAVRSSARQRHQRQGREFAQPRALGQPAGRERELPAASELYLPLHGRVVIAGGARPPILVLAMGGAFVLLVIALLIGSLTRPEFPPYAVTAPHAASVGDSLVGPATYSMLSHLLMSKHHVYGVRTAGGRYAKLELLAYYCRDAGTACVTFRYAYQGDGTPRVAR